jgi:hypothetical protein
MTAEIIQFGAAGKAGQETPVDAYLADVVKRYRSRDRVKEDIDAHTAARDTYGRAVAWEAAAESQNLPPCQIEEARQRTAKAYSHLESCGSMLVICMPHDPRGLVDLLLYLEQNWTTLPETLHRRSIAFDLLKSMRLSLRAVAKYGKYEGSRDDK